MNSITPQNRATPTSLARVVGKGLAWIALAAPLTSSSVHAQAPYFQPGQPGAPRMPMPSMSPTPLPAPGPVVAPLPPAPLTDKTSTVPPPEAAPPQVQAKIGTYIGDIQGPDVRLELETRRSKLVRTRQPVVRVSIADPSVVEIVQFGPSEFELIGRMVGDTTMTLWFAGNENGYQPNLRYLIRVNRDVQDDERARLEYGELQKRINELFPNSYVQLIPVLDKLIVRGQARDAQEATQIMALIRGGSTDQNGLFLGPGSSYGFGGFGFGGGFGGGFGTNYSANSGRVGRIPGVDDMPTSSIINMLEVPGEQQVMLKVRVAELTRSALREMGANFTAIAGDFTFSSLLNVAGAFTAVLNSTDVQLALSAISTNRTSKVLAEPNLITLSGYPASFIAGGQFAVPTAVGVNGVQAVTTNFQGFGTQIQFTPTVIDKDHIRLQVVPTFSTINTGNSVNGIPGLNTRSVSTTVDLREGQWLAIAGLLQDQQVGEKIRVPWLGDIPVLSILFSRGRVTRDETELVILVSPELVHPMEVDQVPQILPGMEVTEPGNLGFYIFGRYEGASGIDHRSTVWPIYGWDAWSGRAASLRHHKGTAGYVDCEQYYMNGPVGFSH